MNEIFAGKEKGTIVKTFKISFFEIYQEQIRDLLDPTIHERDISIRDNNGSIHIKGISERVAETVDDAMKCLAEGRLNRTVGETAIHAHSSRSHAIFSITLETFSRGECTPHHALFKQTDQIVQRSKLHIVDLAGSERLKRTGNEGLRLRESVKINSGLLALGNVVSVLGDEKQIDSERPAHVPYRESKLTRILQDSLGGNALTLMIACISPLEQDLEETVNTLKYANRARKIHNKPILNIIDQQALERTNLHQKINQLELELKERDSALPLKSELVDFDGFPKAFLQELKVRTIKGINAIKALAVLKQEKEELEKELETLRNLTILMKPEVEVEPRISSASLKSLMEFALSCILGKEVEQKETEKVRNVLDDYFTSTSAMEHTLPLNTDSMVNPTARYQRRNRIQSMVPQINHSYDLEEAGALKSKLIDYESLLNNKVTLIAELEAANHTLQNQVKTLEGFREGNLGITEEEVFGSPRYFFLTEIK